jgi:hypothetical protein
MSERESEERVPPMSLKEIFQIASIFISMIGAVYFISGRMSALETTQNNQDTEINQLMVDFRALQTQSYSNDTSIATLDQNVADLRAAMPSGRP